MGDALPTSVEGTVVGWTTTRDFAVGERSSIADAVPGRWGIYWKSNQRADLPFTDEIEPVKDAPVQRHDVTLFPSPVFRTQRRTVALVGTPAVIVRLVERIAQNATQGAGVFLLDWGGLSLETA